ncbi:MAG: sigma-54 dependent transcriptional regulator [Nitrospiraceae bacterium]|nr:sigma-54 dependent transcriptional regulator [Nitrospiraceae bacterium]
MKKSGKVFLVDDDELINSMLSRMLKNSGYDIRTATTVDGIIEKINAWCADIVLLDIRIGDQNGIDVLKQLVEQECKTQVIMLTADDTAETAVKAMKLGAADYLTKPFNIDEVKIVLQNIMERGKLQQEVAYLRKVQSEVFEKEIIGESQAVQDLKTKIRKMADASVSTVLITGESGTGKELFARYAHRMFHDTSRGGFAPFIRVNCAALPETLLETELFGYEKGSFTDAKADKKGLFELAEGGSILLDEIGDMKHVLQGKLLRVLEERTVRPVGGSEEIPIDVTVIATTNRNLDEAVAQGTFRMDLFFRLSAFHLAVPPLRERKEDIGAIARHFLATFESRYKKPLTTRISPEAEKIIFAYPWPGNIRELRNLLERLVVLEGAEEILPEHLPSWLTQKAEAPAEPPQGEDRGGKILLPAKGLSLEELEKDLIVQALDRTHHNKTQAAKLLDLSYDAFRYQVKKFGLE